MPVRQWLRYVALAALLSLAAGCQRGPGAAAAHQESKQVLRRGLGAEPETLDPHLAADNASLAVVADLCEGLTAESADGRIVPGAAGSWSVLSAGRTYVFQLRPGLRWSNGDALTAGQFAAALHTAVAPDSTEPNAVLLQDIERVDAPDATTVRIDLRRPVPYLPALLSLPVAAPLHPSAATLDPRPCNGPYRLVSWRRGDRLELERNPYYRDAGSVPIRRVSYYTVADLATELNLYRAGELDVTSEVPNADLVWIRQHMPSELRVAPYLNTYGYAVNLRRIPDPGARAAIAMAVDRERVTRLVTGAGETPAYGWVPPGLPGYASPGFAWRSRPPSARMAEARAAWLAAVARHAAPHSLTVCTDSSANHHRNAIALADMWREALGVQVKLVELEWSVYLAMRKNPGDCDLVRLGWSADFADPEAFAAVFETGHPQNTLGYSSETYDALLARSRAASNETQRMQLLAEAEQVLLEDVPVIPVFHRVTKRLVKPYVAGYRPNPLGHLATRDLSLTTEAARPGAAP